MLWACLHFPALALNRVEQSLPAPRALVIEIARRQRRLVWQANAPALAAGIAPGMTIAAAQGLCAQLLCVPRNESAELESLRELGDWAYRFTPHIQLQNGDSLLLEVGHSLRLFGSREQLARLLVEELPAGFQPCHLALCDTAFAALLLAQVAVHPSLPTPLPPRQDAAAGDSGTIAASQPHFFSLRDLPAQSVRGLNLPVDKIALLESMGILTLEQLFALPHDALAKRLGRDFMTYLRLLTGVTPDVLPSWKLPDRFTQTLEFLHELDTTDQLLFPLRNLLTRLQHYLNARQLATTELHFHLALRNRSVQHWRVALAAPHYRIEHMLPLLQLKLATLQLQAPVLAVQLDVNQFVPLPAGQQDLLTPWQSDNVSRQQLVDKLKARLGDANVFGLALTADHRPEKSWVACAPGSAAAGSSASTVQRHMSPKTPAAQPAPVHDKLRPFWLLPTPQKLRDKKGLPQYDGDLQLLTGPERIDTGWWDDQPVNRDYFVAQQTCGRLLWIYRDRSDQQWYLHGIFEG